MINLIVNRCAIGREEIFISGDENPSSIKNRVYYLLKDNKEDVKTICTFSPVAIDAYWSYYCFVKCLPPKDVYSFVHVYNGQEDVSVADRHFWTTNEKLSDLYINGRLF